MWEWSDKLKLGKSASAFVKRDIRCLPLTDAEFEADFFLDPKFSTKRQERWLGIAVQREDDALLAMEEVPMPPPTVNSLANLLAHAMLRPGFGDRQRPRIIHLRDRPQWQELLPHLQQLGIEVALADELPWLDEAAVEWVQFKKKNPPSADEIKAVLRKPFPVRKRTWFTDAMAIVEWSHALFQQAYPTRKDAVPLYDLEIVVPICLTADELETILGRTSIARTKKLRPRLEAMATEGKAIEVEIHEWCNVVSARGCRRHSRLSRICSGNGQPQTQAAQRTLGMERAIRS